jgi:hypothetical protein
MRNAKTTRVSAGVVVAQRLRTAKALKEGVCRQHHVLDLLNATVLATGHGRDVLHDTLGRFGLARA